MPTNTDTTKTALSAWQRLLNLIPTPMALLKPSTTISPKDRLLFVNQAYLNIFEHHLQTSQPPLYWFDNLDLHETDRLLLQNEWQKQQKTPLPLHGIRFPSPLRIRCKEDKVCWFDLSYHRYPLAQDAHLVVLQQIAAPDAVQQRFTSGEPDSLNAQETTQHSLDHADTVVDPQLNDNGELAQIIELTHEEIMIFSAEENRCLYANRLAIKNLGYARKELMQLPFEKISLELNYSELHKLAEEKDPSNAKQRILKRIRKDGSRYPVKCTLQKVRFQHQNALAIFSNDISQFKKVEQTLIRQNQLLDNILQNVPARIFWLDTQGNYIGANQNFLDDLKLPNLQALQGKNDLDLPWPAGQGANYFRQNRLVLTEGRSLMQMEDAFIDDEGAIHIWQLSKLALRNSEGEIIGMLGTYQDISKHRQLEIELKEQAQILEHQAFHDALTALPNRIFLQQKIEHEILQAQRNGSEFALLFIDLDHFKQINDSLGHDIGDQVLQEIALKLHHVLRKGDTLARLGGDEFTVIQTPLQNRQDAITLAKKLIETSSEAINIGQHTFYLTSSIGISIYPKDAQTAESLLRAADAAMYLAKDHGRNNAQFYASHLTEQAFAHLSMHTLIHQAIENDEFIPYFQVQIDSLQQRIIGLEVLARWQDSQGKIIAPHKFIPIAEKSGLIVQLDRQVMRKAIGYFYNWRQAGLITGKLSLNLTVKQLEREDFLTFLTQLLKNANCAPHWLEFEITESDIMTRLEEMMLKMNQLRQLGIKIAIDDFGTGYSSLAYLKKLPVSKLKIDQSFIRDLPSDEDDAIITKTIISMAENLGLEVIAEGVETEQQLAFLQANGCYQIQGYLYGKPVDHKATTAFLTRARQDREFLYKAPQMASAAQS